MIYVAELCVIGASVIAFFAIQTAGPVLLLTFYGPSWHWSWPAR